jgi:hypothetical protein
VLAFVLAFVLAVPAAGNPAAYRRGQVSGLGLSMRSQRLNGALVGGGLGLGLGIAGGVLASKAVTDGEKSAAMISLGVGAGLTLGSVLLALIRSPYERKAEEFLRLSESEDADAVERRLATLVTEERRERRFLTVMNLVLSGLVAGIGFLNQSDAREILVGVGAGGVAVSLVTLAFPPPAPWESVATGRLAGREASSAFRFGIAPAPNGAALAAGWQF